MIRSLQHFALGIPDLKVGADFYTTFGLSVQEHSNRLGFRCDDRPHDEVVLVDTGRARKFHHISFGTDAPGLSQIEKNLKARNVPPADPPYKGADEGIWFRDPDGNLVNVLVTSGATLCTEPAPAINGPGRLDRTNERGCPPFDIQPRPRRLGHMILFTPGTATIMYSVFWHRRRQDSITRASRWDQSTKPKSPQNACSEKTTNTLGARGDTA